MSCKIRFVISTLLQSRSTSLPPMASPILKTAVRIYPSVCRPVYMSSSATSNPSSDDVVSSVASILTNYRSKSRWATILSHYPQGLTPLQVSAVLLQIRNNPNLACSFFNFTTENALTSHDLHSFSTIIHIVARARKKSRAQTLIRTAIRTCHPDDDPKPGLFVALLKTYKSCDSAPLVFDLLLRVYLESNRVDSCLYVVTRLQASGFHFSLPTCNLVSSAVARHRGVALGCDLYRNFFQRAKFQPNAATFNGLLVACYHERSLDKAEEIWEEMRRLKCEPDYRTYNIMMAAYCEEESVEKANQLWEEVKSKGLKRDIAAYNTLIGGWCKIGKVEIWKELHKEMEVSGIECSYVTYQHLINGHCKVGDISSAYLLFKEMCRKKHSPDVFIVDLLVRELCIKGMVSQALEVFKYVTKDASFGVRRSSYESLILGFCGNGEMEEALKIQAEMVGKGFEPDYGVYGFFINGYMKLGKTDMADKLREEMNKLCVREEIRL